FAVPAPCGIFTLSLHDALPISPHARSVVPEATGAQVSQEVADVKRGICEAEVIKIYDKNLVTMEEQLAGLESTMRRAIGEFKARDRKSTRLNSSHVAISYAVFC